MVNQQSKIARNSLFLAIRLALMMLLTLYSTRLLLAAMGVEAFGVFQVINSLVLFFAFVQGAMVSAAQRNFSVVSANYDAEVMSDSFGRSLTVHLFLAAPIVVAMYFTGVILLDGQLDIPHQLLDEARAGFTYLCGFIFITMVNVVFQAYFVATENFFIYACVGIFEAMLRVAAALALPADQAYESHISDFSAAMFLLGLTMVFVNSVLVARLHGSFAILVPSSKFTKDIFYFISWNTLGNLAAALALHGNNLILNGFFGPVVNAGRGVAVQVTSAITGISQTSQTGFNPQIIKGFTNRESKNFYSLLFLSSRVSFFITLIICIPLLFNIMPVLNFWLSEIPGYAVGFLQLGICLCLIESVSGPLMTAAQAHGKIFRYQVLVSLVLLANLPICYSFLLVGFGPMVVPYVTLCLAVVAMIVRLKVVSGLVDLDASEFVKHVLLRCLLVGLSSAAVCWALGYLLETPHNFWQVVQAIVIDGGVCAFVIWLFGFSAEEKERTYRNARKYFAMGFN